MTVYRASDSIFFTFNLLNGSVRMDKAVLTGTVRPASSPLTTWFTFGASGAIPAVANPAGLDFAPMAALTPATSSTSTPARKASMVNRPIVALGLESGRPGS